MAQVILHPREGRSPKDYALMYVGLGWKVFPVWGTVPLEGGGRGCACMNRGLPEGQKCDRPAKHPIADVCPSGVSDASSERSKVEAWWGRYPEASVGIATGAVSGITVIDADAGDGKPGLINLTRLCAEHGGVPSTFAVETGGGGLHLYFKYNAALRTGVNVLDAAIDVRSDGGYVIAPPSAHVRGAYKWREDRAELKELPEWMINAPQAAHDRSTRRRRGRPRTREALPLETVEDMLQYVESEDRDRWLKMGLLLGRMYVGTASEGEAWSMYEAWAARSPKFDNDRGANITRMREQFYEASQAAPRAGSEPIGVGTLCLWAKEGGWTPFGDRAEVRYEPGNESSMCSSLVAALVANHEANRHFNIMGEVRDVLITALPSLRAIVKAQAEGSTLPETLVVRRATLSGLQSALSERAVLTVTTENGPKARPIPDALVSMILKDHANEFPPLSGVCEWPMVMAGKVVVRPRGYDPATGLYFDIAASLVIDERLSAADAWKWLREEFFIDFPFENDMHRARALAMMLGMMQRPLMKTCPAFAITAPQPGTGKSTLVEAAAFAIHGSNVFSHPLSSDEEELRKALHALMIAKVPTVMFDNVGRGKAIHSDHLAKLITSEAASDRTLGSSETRTEVNSMLLTFTGNNIVFTKDMASRVIAIRLNAHSVNPIGRAFRHPDLRVWAAAQRSKILSCLVAIARAGHDLPVAGRSSRFEDFDSLIVGPVLRVTGQDVRIADATTDVGSDEDDVAEARGVLRVLREWQQEARGERCGKRWHVTELLAALEAHAFPEATVNMLKRWAGGERRWMDNPARCLGYALRAVRDGHEYAPFVLTGKARDTGQHWRIIDLEHADDPTSAPQERF